MITITIDGIHDLMLFIRLIKGDDQDIQQLVESLNKSTDKLLETEKKDAESCDRES